MLGVVALCACLRSEPQVYLGVLAPWRFEGSPAILRCSDLVWSGDSDLVQGTWRPPSLVGKLLSRNRDQGDRRLDVSLCGESRSFGRDLVAGKQYSL